MKKRDKKLYRAIVELNRDIAGDLGIEFVEDESLLKTFYHVKSNPKSINQTFSAYKKYILQK